MTPEEYKKAIVTISKDTLALLPAAEFNGEIVVIEDKDKLLEIIPLLRSEKLLGFDTETRPSFKKGHTYKIALIQIATRNAVYLIRTNILGYPQELLDILQDKDILKVGLSLHDDFHNLRKVVDFKPAGFVDLQSYVKEYKIADNSLSRLYGILFDKRISKSQRLSNWEARPLSEAQQAYAALDALACIKIYDYLQEGGFNPRESKYLTLPPEPETGKEKEEK